MNRQPEVDKPDKPQGGLQRIALLTLVAMAVVAAVYLKGDRKTEASSPLIAATTSTGVRPASQGALPKLIDLGAGKCIPCKAMAPILEALKSEFHGSFEVQFIDVWENPGAGEQYGIQLIPTQIFYDASGMERFRHEGFYSRDDILAKWKELGVELGDTAAKQVEFSRWDPAIPDARPKETICYMCDGDINPRTRAILKTDKGDVAFCSLHCFFITYSSMTEAKPNLDDVSVTDWSDGALISAKSANYVYGVDAAQRPTIKAFKDTAAAALERTASGGNGLEWASLQDKELATRCGFCDRAVYPEDACGVKVEGLSTFGCCTMCALGVAARLNKDIEVTAKDGLTGETIVVSTLEGHVSALTPATAVAWAGAKKDAEGKIASTGCFKQAFFANEDNLRQWVLDHPTATGRLVTMEQALAEKMKLTPQQISKACKIGECSPK
ncbi:MAG: hypothetical protein AMXMBFR84_39080 [Candidatus Hydrogenedentota bacterium]